MSAPLRLQAGIIIALATLSACGTLPGSGPSAGALARSDRVDIVQVTPAQANAAAASGQAATRDRVDLALARLSAPAEPATFRFGPGASLTLTLWSFSSRPEAGGGASPTALGTYTVSAEGDIVLPYAGTVPLSGLTLPEAQATLDKRFAALGMFQSPSVAIQNAGAPQGHVTVTGLIGQPKAIAWPPAGLTLSDALTQALGDGAAVLGQPNDTANNVSAIQVALYRGEGAPVTLPIATALEQTIALRPGDRVVVEKATPIEVTVLGGGARSNGALDFAEAPSLAQVLAKVSGLNGALANNHAIFVLRQRAGGRPILYDFAWDRAQGLIASQRFPLESGDLVYVAEAPIISAQQVISILFQLTLPAQVLK
jgi:polysaccharide export outer membrane protein